MVVWRLLLDWWGAQTSGRKLAGGTIGVFLLFLLIQAALWLLDKALTLFFEKILEDTFSWKQLEAVMTALEVFFLDRFVLGMVSMAVLVVFGPPAWRFLFTPREEQKIREKLNGQLRESSDVELHFAADDRCIFKRIPQGGEKKTHVVHGILETNKTLVNASPKVENISRFEHNEWRKLNGHVKMKLCWTGELEEERTIPAGTQDSFVVFNFHGLHDNILSLFSKTPAPSFTERANLPIGKYKMKIVVTCSDGVAFDGVYLVDWYGDIEAIHIEKQE